MNRQEAIDKHFETLFSLANNTARLEYQRWAAKNDLFYLLVAVLGRKDANRDWIYERCREVEAAPDGYLDLWAREHYKSTIITFALTIRDILRDPEVPVGIFSYSRPIAKAFLRQIKYEFEANAHLRSLFSDILWENPHRDAPKWSEDDGIIVKRAGNPKEPIDCDEPVLTTGGWKSHGDLVVGDRVFGPDGNPTTVTAVSDVWYDLPCYRVVFGNHSVVAAATHKWALSSCHGNGVYTTEEIKERLERNRHKPTAVGVTEPLQLPHVDLPIDPYILGCWLGDGHSASARFTTSREDYPHFLEELIKAKHSVYVYEERENTILCQIDCRDRSQECRRGHNMQEVGVDSAGRCKACNKDRSKPYTVNGLSWRLRNLGLLDNKHVPNAYLMVSAKQRLALLQGLMDTDGCSAEDGQAIFANTNKQISRSVYFLAASLGMKPTLKRRERKYKGSPHVMWWVTFVAHVDKPVFRLARKLRNGSLAVDHPRRHHRMINAVEKVPSRPVSCIQVDNTSGCYLVGEALITTHNSTIEAWGLVDGQPTSKHFGVMVYDDVVTAESVTTPEMIKKVTTAWETSRNLTTEGGRTRYVGTRWSHNDTYREILARGAAIERRHPVTLDGTVEGEPVLWTRERVAEKRREMGPYSFNSQLLLDPTADRSQGFRDEWLRFYDNLGDGGLTKYLLVDAANEKNKRSDYTAAVVIGLGNDGNYYLLDMVRDRLNLTERAEMVFLMHRRWKPLRVGYEKYGLMADIEHIKDRMGRETYHFDIVELGGRMGKNERIKRLVPIFEAGRFWFPESLNKINYEKRMVDLIKAFIDEEYKAFPVGIHDDMLDAMSRITDEEMSVAWPRQRDEGDRYTRRRERFRVYSSWAA